MSVLRGAVAVRAQNECVCAGEEGNISSTSFILSSAMLFSDFSNWNCLVSSEYLLF